EAVAAAEPSEPVGEAVVVSVGGQDRFTEQGGEDDLVLGDPGLDVVEAVIPLGDEEEEPDGQNLAGGERAFPVGRGREVTVQGGRQVQPRQGRPQNGQVGHGLDTQQAGCAGVHSSRLRTAAFPENHPEHERTGGSRASPRHTVTSAPAPSHGARSAWPRVGKGSFLVCQSPSAAVANSGPLPSPGTCWGVGVVPIYAGGCATDGPTGQMWPC